MPIPAAGAGTPKNGRDPGKPGLWPGTWSTPTCKIRFKPISGRLRRVIMKSFIRKFPVPATSQSRHLPGLKCLAGAGPGRARGSTPAAGPGFFRMPTPACRGRAGLKKRAGIPANRGYGRGPGRPLVLAPPLSQIWSPFEVWFPLDFQILIWSPLQIENFQIA